MVDWLRGIEFLWVERGRRFSLSGLGWAFGYPCVDGYPASCAKEIIIEISSAILNNGEVNELRRGVMGANRGLESQEVKSYLTLFLGKEVWELINCHRCSLTLEAAKQLTLVVETIPSSSPSYFFTKPEWHRMANVQPHLTSLLQKFQARLLSTQALLGAKEYGFRTSQRDLQYSKSRGRLDGSGHVLFHRADLYVVFSQLLLSSVLEQGITAPFCSHNKLFTHFFIILTMMSARMCFSALSFIQYPQSHYLTGTPDAYPTPVQKYYVYPKTMITSQKSPKPRQVTLNKYSGEIMPWAFILTGDDMVDQLRAYFGIQAVSPAPAHHSQLEFQVNSKPYITYAKEPGKDAQVSRDLLNFLVPEEKQKLINELPDDPGNIVAQDTLKLTEESLKDVEGHEGIGVVIEDVVEWN
ncbi:uncharacterized protein BDR25DRAFT_357866 [Lindgomyces ingoldianus]|uniref:Uncharacterized protein n=1 Tax=Lindgomyces ingoldianus TaxID=673940 RepID=A0ACB6QMI5_9PLEO|nr:uncharacterized protein BDR25DRAFT_357866 [Lindgomyces ingoldianus]KAF2468121.1 hypothetical protein BDR25DRAFT_357866 [Lindgomyces ingoldianus]